MSIAKARLNKSQVVSVYSQMAPVYDFWGTLTETQARKRALALANIRNGESVLEVAVGTGLTFQELLKANSKGQTVGVDLTPAMLEKAKRKAQKVGHDHYELAVGDAYHLEFPDHHFDLLMNNYMFDLLPEADFSRVLSEFRRVLKPGGRIVLVNMTKGSRFYEHFWEALYHLNPRWLGGCRGVLLSEALNDVGFSDLYRESMSQLGFPSEVIVAIA
jgi:ubiquinone/menaquinone biosynthesis C-methylase UbiE